MMLLYIKKIILNSQLHITFAFDTFMLYNVICLDSFDIQTPKQHVGSNSVIMSFYLTDLRDKHHGNTNTNNYI